MTTKSNRQTAERETKRGTNPNSLANLKGGSRKGVPNKTTALLKDAILRAAEKAGNKVGDEGLVSYLEDQADKNPGPFMSLLGKVLPMQVTGEDGGAIGVVIFKGLNENG